MDRLEAMRLLIAAVETGSFSAAARKLGVPLPTLSRKIGERDDLKEQDTGAEDLVLWMPDSINKLEAALLEGRIAVEVNPVMTMCAAGVVYEENRTGHRMFNKPKATSRIDGMVSLAMSIGVATVEAPVKKLQLIIA